MVDGELVASISFDCDNHEDLYWRVIINGQEIFRDTTAPRCQSYIKQQYQQSTLPVQEPFVEPCTTGNEIMVQIANDCEKQGLELFEIIQKDDTCWFVQASLEPQQIVPELLSEDLSCEEILDKPFHLLTSEQWEQLREYQPASDCRELVAV